VACSGSDGAFGECSPTPAESACSPVSGVHLDRAEALAEEAIVLASIAGLPAISEGRCRSACRGPVWTSVALGDVGLTEPERQEVLGGGG
jgi:hypothetical protein